MKKEKPELKVIVHGELDLSKLPKDVLDALVDALVENICKLVKNEKESFNF